jgi:hypothetical protein
MGKKLFFGFMVLVIIAVVIAVGNFSSPHQGIGTGDIANAATQISNGAQDVAHNVQTESIGQAWDNFVAEWLSYCK